MRRILFYAAIFVASFYLGEWLFSDDTYIKTTKRLGEAAFVEAKWAPMIRLETTSGKFFCSGFVIDAAYAVTAAHCLGVTNNIAIYDSNGVNTEIVAKPVCKPDRVDYGLIEGDFSAFKPVQAVLNDFDLWPNKPYVSCGFPFGSKRLFCIGIQTTDIDYFSMAAHGYLLPGMSGGAVMNPQTNMAVGVNSAVGEGHVNVVPLLGLGAACNVE